MKTLQTTRARKREWKQSVAKCRRELAKLPVVEPRRRIRPATTEEWDADVDGILAVLQAIRALPEMCA